MQSALAVDPETKRQLLKEAETSLRVCLAMDAADPRGYVILGKLLVQQKRYDEARKLYADGTTATGKKFADERCLGICWRVGTAAAVASAAAAAALLSAASLQQQKGF
jgi:hypothetical protein